MPHRASGTWVTLVYNGLVKRSGFDMRLALAATVVFWASAFIGNRWLRNAVRCPDRQHLRMGAVESGAVRSRTRSRNGDERANQARGKPGDKHRPRSPEGGEHRAGPRLLQGRSRLR